MAMAITPFKTVAAGVAMLTLLMVFAIPPSLRFRLRCAPARQVGETSPANAEELFDAAWQDTVAAVPPSLRYGEAGPPLKKADRLQIASIEPKPVTERMPPAPNAPVSVPPVILVQDEVDKPLASRHRRHHAPGNVCTRHNMRKVIVRKSWRCRK